MALPNPFQQLAAHPFPAKFGGYRKIENLALPRRQRIGHNKTGDPPGSLSHQEIVRQIVARLPVSGLRTDGLDHRYTAEPIGDSFMRKSPEGLNMAIQKYRITCTATIGSAVTTVERLVDLTMTPLFQFLIFYNNDLRGLPGPRLLAGDLNLTAAAVHRWSGMRALANAATFPSAAPNRQLDHILTDDAGLRGGAVEADLMPISDHRPLLVDVQRV